MTSAESKDLDISNAARGVWLVKVTMKSPIVQLINL